MTNENKLWRSETVSFTLRTHWLQNRGLNKPEGSTLYRPGKSRGLSLAHKTSDSQKLLRTFLCNAVEVYGGKKNLSSGNDSIRIVTRGIQMPAKKALQSGKSTDDHNNTAIYVLRWSKQLLKLENKSYSESVMTITEQRD